MCIRDRNYRNSNKNRKNEIYYYIVKTNKLFDMKRASLDESEIEGNYNVKMFELSDVEKVLIDSIPLNVINQLIVEEMLDVLNEYKNRLR